MTLERGRIRKRRRRQPHVAHICRVRNASPPSTLLLLLKPGLRGQLLRLELFAFVAQRPPRIHVLQDLAFAGLLGSAAAKGFWAAAGAEHFARRRSAKVAFTSALWTRSSCARRSTPAFRSVEGARAPLGAFAHPAASSLFLCRASMQDQGFRSRAAVITRNTRRAEALSKSDPPPLRSAAAPPRRPAGRCVCSAPAPRVSGVVWRPQRAA